jgi:hypothetical protein
MGFFFSRKEAKALVPLRGRAFPIQNPRNGPVDERDSSFQEKKQKH